VLDPGGSRPGFSTTTNIVVVLSDLLLQTVVMRRELDAIAPR